MTNIPELETSQLENLAWEANLQLREKLIQLRFEMPPDEVNKEVLNTEVETLMRSLDNYHSCLYIRQQGIAQDTDSYFSPSQPSHELAEKLKDYYKWRFEQIGGAIPVYSKRVHQKLKDFRQANPKKHKRLFQTELYKTTPGFDDYGNHWHIVQTFNSGDSQDGEWFMDNAKHTDLSFTDIIFSHKNGLCTEFFHGVTIKHGDETLSRNGAGLVRKLLPITGMNCQDPSKREIVIGKTGKVTFNM